MTITLKPEQAATSSVVFAATQSLCRKHGLTAYDAAYLEIAMREACALATVDQQLKRAAVAEV
jgi:predicted nucleic acid-binding protein